MNTVFAAKLDRIGDTLPMCFQADHAKLARMMAQCARHPVYSVGSGGSVVIAEFLAHCRAQLEFAMTSSVTPMSFVIENVDPAAMSWFFSASGENEDIQAAFEHGLRSSPQNLFVLTNSESGSLARLVRDHGGTLFVSPVAEPKDGFLATHSIISSALSLVLASDRLVGRDDAADRFEHLRHGVMRHVSRDARTRLGNQLDGLLRFETLVLLHDPQLAAAATLIETSAWEAGLCSIQRTDFRNFAHGRHVWLDKHAQSTLVLALTSERSAAAWQTIDGLLPREVKRISFGFGRAGRASELEALAFGLAFIEALGGAKGIDPGKPGVAEFGRKIFDSSALRNIVSADVATVRRKRHASARVDAEPTLVDLSSSRAAFVAKIEHDKFGGVVLDYDGTVVATDQRFDPPAPEILSQIRRLIDADISVAFATGRGGSIGEMLRGILPQPYHARILVGYYNGAWIVPLATDISVSPPPLDTTIAEARRRLMTLAGLFREGWKPKDAPLQLAIPIAKFSNQEKGMLWLHEALADLPLRILQSGHAVDVFPAWASKRDVVARVRDLLLAPDNAILCIGDRGERLGNDHELLEGPHGVSVGKVCDRPHTCWNLAPDASQGPAGLQLLLKALKVVDRGTAKLCVPDSFSFG